MRNVDPESEENQRQTHDNERYVGALKLQASLGMQIEDCDGDDIQSEVCEHVAVGWEPGVTSTGVKLGKCRHCGEQVERSVS